MSGLPGLTPVASGKVRDLYAVGSDRLLVVASDRVSAYDYVLPTPIPGKGTILTALSLWWYDRLADLVPNHLVTADVARYPAELRAHAAALTGRSMVVRRLDMVPVECVARGYLTGSGLADYRETGAVCGVRLPPGLVDGSRLPEPVFTPATKAPVGGHDVNVSYDEVVEAVGADTAAELRRLTLAIYRRGAALARERGLLLADTKLEFGHDPAGRMVLADEVLTPDSSRFWSADAWRPGPISSGTVPPAYDKQVLRDWLRTESGWDPASGASPPPLPPEVVLRTLQRYREAYRRLTGHPQPAA
ncbi:MAG: phosphoribosylaminoimidazolesuccinocarboxamide synthase [Actinomycetota bacterium]|nr:phosphoribosylaminoimidazolesuccinocarboxamide synthase [Acidothermales bacterium]MDQ3432305.1 phosphoribosylaminoimidazolesuccinocarboxamide synthase [Actinomycetota bacterium]